MSSVGKNEKKVGNGNSFIIEIHIISNILVFNHIKN